jgi:hypothetical protein
MNKQITDIFAIANEWLLLHPKRKHPSKDGCFSFAVTTVSRTDNRLRYCVREEVAVDNLWIITNKFI